MEVVTAHYSPGCMLLAEAAGPTGRGTRLMAATRNLTAQTLPSNAVSTQAPGLREVVNVFESLVPGEPPASVPIHYDAHCERCCSMQCSFLTLTLL